MSADHGDRLRRIDSRNEFELRRRRVVSDLEDYAFRAQAHANALLVEFPHLEGEDPRVLFSRFIVPETAPDYESALRRAAFALLHLRAIDRSEQQDPFTGGEAA